MGLFSLLRGLFLAQSSYSYLSLFRKLTVSPLLKRSKYESDALSHAITRLIRNDGLTFQECEEFRVRRTAL